MRDDRVWTEATMVATHERRSGSAGGGPLPAGLAISCLMIGTASSWKQRSRDEPDYPHAYPREGGHEQRRLMAPCATRAA